MDELTAELISQQKAKIEYLEKRIETLENGELVKETQRRNLELTNEVRRLQGRVDDIQSIVGFYTRIITYFLNKEE